MAGPAPTGLPPAPTRPTGSSGGVVPLGRVLGVPVQLAPSWFLFAGLVVLSYGPELSRTLDPTRGYLLAAAFAVLLLASVLLHEVGHCVTARLLGLRVRRITVSFLAGLTEVVDPPRTPAAAGAVSASGPLVSVLLALVAGLAARAAAPGGDLRSLLVLAAISNAGLAVFNLLPGLPLDGGGVLRALVWRLTGDRARGTVLAAQAGRLLGLGVVPLAVLVVAPLSGRRLSTIGIVTTAFVAAFLYLGATAALRAARVEQRLGGVSAGALSRPALQVVAGLPLAEALRRAHAARLHAVVVVDAGGVPRAVVSEAAVAAVPEHRRPWVPTGDLARPLTDGLVLDPGLDGEDLLEAVRRTPASEYVVRGPAPTVLVTADLERVLGGTAPAAARGAPAVA